MKTGDRIRLKNGDGCIITSVGMGDFIGDPAPVYYMNMRTGIPGFIMSNELQPCAPKEGKAS